ncbi:protein of unknown function [Methylocella tundrae]|uniref:Uncharacterized protein n=1 Tax=Methylocella tundrae TaxID=227605 RepID=A0A4U8Z2E9_METTU|nr:protein of unknown function [Methylocella tundrae]
MRAAASCDRRRYAFNRPNTITQTPEAAWSRRPARELVLVQAAGMFLNALRTVYDPVHPFWPDAAN